VIDEQVGLYRSLVSPPGSSQPSPGTPGPEAEDVPVDPNVVPFRKTGEGSP